MTVTFSDLAGDAVRDVQNQQKQMHQSTEVDSQESEEVKSSKYLSLYEKIKFTWHDSEKNALIQLRAAAEATIVDIFGPVFSILDDIYNASRTPQVTSHGQIKVDIDGRTMWVTDSKGTIEEDWANVSSLDIESALFKLSTLKLSASQQVADLFLEAVFAKHALTDSWNESYESVIEGTVGDRTAKANRVSKDDKYSAYFRYYIFYKADCLIKEITQIMRILDRILEFRHRRG